MIINNNNFPARNLCLQGPHKAWWERDNRSRKRENSQKKEQKGERIIFKRTVLCGTQIRVKKNTKGKSYATRPQKTYLLLITGWNSFKHIHPAKFFWTTLFEAIPAIFWSLSGWAKMQVTFPQVTIIQISKQH